MAENLDSIITVSITRETSVVTKANFGQIGIIAEFETDKTNTTFDRYRTYNSLSEMTDDGWLVTDEVYLAASKIFSQDPNPSIVVVGRKDQDDASWAAALTAIQTAYSQWYGFTAITSAHAGKIVWDADFITGNLIDITVDGVAVTQVLFNSSHAQTMADIKTQIEADITGANCVIDSSDSNTRMIYVDKSGKYTVLTEAVTGGASQADGTISIIPITLTTVVFSADFVTGNLIDFTVGGEVVTQVPFNSTHNQTMIDIQTEIESDIDGSEVLIPGTARTLTIRTIGTKDITTVVVTGGASQPTATITRTIDVDIKAIAAWTETEAKIYFYSSNDPNIKLSASTTDIAYFMNSQNYDRTVSIYHLSNPDTFIETAWPGECFPYPPGSQTWMFKTLTGVATYELTSSEATIITGKECNVYTEIAGIDMTKEGVVASGEYIDVIRGVDWITASMQEDIFAALVNSRKIPFTDSGISVVVGIVKDVLEQAVANDILVADSAVVTYPKASEVSAANKGNRLLPDIEFTATLAGAIHKVEISGTVSL